ncbi:MAG TPA: CopD family protein [Methylocella sp.]|nr:CopD family protein [Methylocella sp.]
MTIFQYLVLAQDAAQDVGQEAMGQMDQSSGQALWLTWWPLVITRGIHFASVFVLFGSSFFWFYMPREHSFAHPGQLTKTLAATTIMLRIAAPILAISGVAWMALVLINMTSDFHSVVNPEDLRLFFYDTPVGTVSIIRLALFAIAVVVAFLPWHGRLWYSALLHIGALLLISQAWLGHAAEGGSGVYGAIMITVYAIHMFAAGAWVGGLPPLLSGLVEQRRFTPEEARVCTVDILSRFSLMGMVTVTLIVATGIANAGFRVAGSFGVLFDTEYGNVLFTKIGFVAVMLTLAYFNRFVFMPKLRRAELKGIKHINRLGRSVAFELVLGMLVIAAAAVLGITPPPQ